jgi:hypothetical protein
MAELFVKSKEMSLGDQENIQHLVIFWQSLFSLRVLEKKTCRGTLEQIISNLSTERQWQRCGSFDDSHQNF